MRLASSRQASLPRCSGFLSRAIIIVLLLALLVPSATAQTTRATCIEVTATTSGTSPCVTLNWPAISGVRSFRLWVRAKGSADWGVAITLSNNATSYADTNAQPGIAYEYSLRADVSSYTVYGAIVAGYNIPLVDQRGNVIVLVDSSMAVPLANEISQLEQDLVADGWVVYRHDVPRQTIMASSSNASDYAPRLAELRAVRRIVQREYNNNGAGDNWSLLILGRVPVPYSGNIRPDGHLDHMGAWPTDLYYADVNGSWKDVSVASAAAEDPRNWNLPGDGKFDEAYAPGSLELQCGRVDLANMPNVPTGISETELLRQYLVRNHRFRRKIAPFANVARRGIVDDNFGYFGGAAFASSGWRTGFSWFGNTSGKMDAGDWFGTLQTTPMLLAYGCGAGNYSLCTGIGYSNVDFNKKDSKAVFTMLFGSYFGDWDNAADNILRAPLAGTPNSMGLASMWSGFGYFNLFHMALGDTVGYSVRHTQNSPGFLVGEWPGGWGPGAIQSNLMGDPTLRLHSIAPPAKVTGVSSAGGIAISWTPSAESGLSGYHVYRSTSAAGPFTRLTGIAATGSSPTGSCLSTSVLSYTDTDVSLAAGTSYTYLVKAVKMETSASGTYANQSLGAAVTLTHLEAVPTPIAPTRLAVSRTSATTCVLTWDDNASNETAYLVERCDPVTGIWSQIASLPANSTSYTDLAAAVGQIVNYRIRAAGAGVDSAYSGVAADYNRPGIFTDTAFYYITTKGVGTFNALAARLSGSAGNVSINYTTSDVLSSATDYTPVSTGTLTWNHGESGNKQAPIPITNLSGTQPTKIFKITYTNPTGSLVLSPPTSSYVFVTDPAALALTGTWATTTMGEISATDPGYAEIANGSYGIATRGMDWGIGSTADTARYLHNTVTGDFRLTARVSYLSSTGPNVRAGIMVRESLSSNSSMNSVILSANSRSCIRYSRDGSGASSIAATASSGWTVPTWLRVTRLGNVFKSEQSTNGVTWTPAGSDITLASIPASAYVGFSISTDPTEGNVGPLGYARFDNVTLLTGTIPTADPVVDYSTGFENTAYSGNGTRLSFTDPTSGNTWTTVVSSGSLGATINSVSSQANPAGGIGNHLRFFDLSTTQGAGTYLNTGATTAGNSSQSLRIAFKYAVTSSSGSSGNGMNFGDGPATPYNFGNNWVEISAGRDSGSLTNHYRAIFMNYNTGPGTGKTTANTYKADGTYFNYVPGTYVSIVCLINPITFQYQSIQVNGVEQLGMKVASGLLPGIPAVAYAPMTSAATAPLSYCHMFSNSAGTATFDVDDVVFALMTPWQQWQADNFGVDWNSSAIAGPHVVAAADGSPNLLKYAFGHSVKDSVTANPPPLQSGSTWQFTYQRPANRADISYAVEVSNDLKAWTTSGVSHARTVTGESEIWQASYPADGSPVFFRIKITKP